ncbi:MAG: histidinol-phosphatase HisJ family protein [Flavobacteriales bacterium]|nr:histidinol-phosphatase HisJ family protein [Flavobacteriales bacterium]MDW8433024.1 histidinol-phosphatase HisJ family protein [Flavobacteriales bacterium]
MTWAGNLHGHSYYCDGIESPEAYVQMALAKGHRFIGFSSHIPLAHHSSTWNMAPEKFFDYLNEIHQLKKDYSGLIKIFCGFEMDDPFSLYSCAELRDVYEDFVDYTVGSLHYAGTLPDGSLWEVDGATEKFMRGVDALCDGSIRKAVEVYFSRLREMLIQSRPTVAGHLDKILIHEPVREFQKAEPEFFDLLMGDLLSEVVRLGIVVEINTRGLYTGRHNDYYPSRRHWLFLRKYQIPVVIHSDCHAPEEVDQLCQEAWEEALEHGLNVKTLPTSLACHISDAPGPC